MHHWCTSYLLPCFGLSNGNYLWSSFNFKFCLTYSNGIDACRRCRQWIDTDSCFPKQRKFVSMLGICHCHMSLLFEIPLSTIFIFIFFCFVFYVDAHISFWVSFDIFVHLYLLYIIIIDLHDHNSCPQIGILVFILACLSLFNRGLIFFCLLLIWVVRSNVLFMCMSTK